jgi:hypothetical protein
VCAGDEAVTILDLVQVLDEKIAATRFPSQERLHFCKRARLDGTALGATPPPAVSPLPYRPALQPPSSRTRQQRRSLSALI